MQTAAPRRSFGRESESRLGLLVSYQAASSIRSLITTETKARISSRADSVCRLISRSRPQLAVRSKNRRGTYSLSQVKESKKKVSNGATTTRSPRSPWTRTAATRACASAAGPSATRRRPSPTRRPASTTARTCRRSSGPTRRLGFFASDHLASRSFGHVDERFKTFRLIRIEIERVDLTKMMASLDFFAGHASPKKPQVICLEESRAVRMRL